jgi:hypothetical protein
VRMQRRSVTSGALVQSVGPPPVSVERNWGQTHSQRIMRRIMSQKGMPTAGTVVRSFVGNQHGRTLEKWDSHIATIPETLAEHV